VTEIHLDCVGKVPGADQAKFDELAEKAKAGCPISRLLNTKITLTKTLQK
jgi:osmotically inducible protein OsmC